MNGKALQHDGGSRKIASPDRHALIY